MFSSSFVSSAASGVDTSCTVSIARAVDVGRRLRRRGVDAADHLRRRLRRPVLAARVDALRRHREMEVLAGLQARALLEDRLQDLARRARPRRRLEHDDLAALQHRREARARRARCRRGRARAGARAASAGRSGRRAPASPARSRSSRRRGPSSTSCFEPLGADVLDVALAAVQRVDDVRLHVDEEHAAARLAEGGGERHADVARADDGDVVEGLASDTAVKRTGRLRSRSAAWPSPYSGGASAGKRAVVERARRGRRARRACSRRPRPCRPTRCSGAA